MKYLLFILFLFTAGFITNLNSKEETTAKGFYGGSFDATKYGKETRPTYSNKITISIEYISNNKISGRSIVAGNERPFSGTYKKENNEIIAEVKEPGDDKYDGVFTFKINPGKTISGVWEAYNNTLAVIERKYDLDFFIFKYNPNNTLTDEVAFMSLYNKYEEYKREQEAVTEDVLKFNPSKVLLKKKDVENMHKGDLEILRNSIYARHGYSFKNRKMRYVFDSIIDWYHPIKTDVRKDLTEIEKKNEELLKRYEKYAEKYYDVFGR